MSAGDVSLFGTAAARDALRVEAEAFVGRSLTMMRRARALADADRARAIPLLTERRLALAGHFGRYQRFKHGRIFDPVVMHGAPSSRIVAQTMKLDCMELGESFGAYHRRWLGLRASEWQDYRHDMTETVDTLTRHLEAELRAICQLLMISSFHYSGRPALAVA